MNTKFITVSLIVVAIIAIGGYVFPRVTELVVERVVELGAFAGPDIYDTIRLHEGVEVGGGNFATSSIGAVTYTAGQVFNNKLITHTAASALTATLPASSTISQIAQPSMTHTVFITPVTTGITFAGGAGTELNTASSTKFCVAGSLCRLDFVRKANTDIEVLLTNASGL